MGKLKHWFTEMRNLTLEIAKTSVTAEVMLNSLTQFCVEHLNAAFARIWLIDEKEETLILKASQGQYTRLDGTRSKIKIGQNSKVDKIYTQNQPHITNDTLNDPGVVDKEWVKKEGFISFAGYPLYWSGEKLGVLGMYSREKLEDDLLLVLGIFNLFSSAIVYQQNQTEKNMASFCKVTGFSRKLFDQLIKVGE